MLTSKILTVVLQLNRNCCDEQEIEGCSHFVSGLFAALCRSLANGTMGDTYTFSK